jgi:iron only hydrogenase large subunit-like protein
VCPVGAIYEYDQSAEVWAFLNEKNHDMVIKIAPQEAQAVCAELGLPTEAITIGKIITGLKRMGFSSVYNAESFAAMSANEEAGELLDRIKGSGQLPMISCCSTGGVKFVKEFYPDLANRLSTAKSPEQNFKDFCNKKALVSIAPCIAKKYKTSSEGDIKNDGIILSARELTRLIRLSGIDLSTVQESAFDSYSGEIPDIETKGRKPDRLLEVCGLANARKVLDAIRAGNCDADYVKILSCPSGCKTGAMKK